MIAYWAELLGHAGHQLDHNFSLGAKRKLASVIHFHQRSRQVEEQSAISSILRHFVDSFYAAARVGRSPAVCVCGDVWGVAPVKMVADMGEDLVENFRARLGLLARDDQRRIDPHRREVAHHQEAASKRFLEDGLGYRTAEHLLGLAV